MKLLNVDKNTGELIIENEIILATPEFKKLKDRLVVGGKDLNGYSKTYNKKELLYVFFIADWTGDNWLAGYSDNERHKAAIKECVLEENFKPDNDILKAIEKYIEIQKEHSPTISALITAKRSLNQAGKFIVDIVKQTEILQETVKKLTGLVKDEEDIKQTSSIMSQINTFNTAIKSNINDLLSTVSTITKYILDIEKLERKVKEEHKESIERVGNKKFGTREKPNYKIDPL